MNFSDLDLPEPVRRGIEAAGFTSCTPIQEAALPLALRGKDLAGQSQTGTGKTAAFLIAAFTHCLRHPAPPKGPIPAPRVLIIAPTRELVVQIESDARLLGEFTGLKILAVYGGIDYAKQRDSLAGGVDLLVGTPGRLIDYLKQNVWSPRKVEILVIDEADRMFDMGFIADLRFILRRLPPHEKRQSFLFSATLSFRVLELTWEFMNNPAQITITPKQKTVEKTEQLLYHVGGDEKFNLLLGLLKREGGNRILMFTNMREEARRLEDRLIRNGWEARALTGDMDQKRRLRLLNEFKEGKLPILIATDVASRGLHIEGVSHVVNWDVPQDPEDYVHRIGRTGRAGLTGEAISLVSPDDLESLGAIEKLIRKRIDRVLVPGFEPDGATIAALMGRDAVPIRDVAPRRDVRTRNSAPAPRLVPAHATAPRQASAGPQRPADPIFSKPYEPGTATAAPAESAAVPSRQRQRPVAALLGGLKRAAG